MCIRLCIMYLCAVRVNEQSLVVYDDIFGIIESVFGEIKGCTSMPVRLEE